MARTMHIYCDLDRAVGVVSATNSTLAQYRFFQNDTVGLVLHGLRANTSSALAGAPYETAGIAWTMLVASLSLVDAAPSGGTFKVRVTGGGENPPYEDTSAFNADVLKSDFEAALNSLTLVSQAGGVSVIAGDAPNIFRIQKADPESLIAFSVVENKLSPVCFSDVRIDPDTPGKCELKLYRAPVALTDAFSLPLPPAISAPTRVRVGSATRNEVQRIIIPAGAVGQFALDFNGLAGELVAISGIKATGFATALNNPYTSTNATDVRFAVTNPAVGVFDIEFVGAFAKSSQPLFTVEMFDQTPTDLPQAELKITSLRVEDLLDTAAQAPLLFEIAAFDANGAKTTLFQQPASIINNAIDATAVTQAEQLLLTRTETVYQYVDPSQPMLAGIFGIPFAPTEAAQDYTFVHDFGTWRPIVEVYRKTSEVPEVWSRVPSNQFTVEATTSNQVRVYGFAFTVEAGKLHVDVIDPDARVLINTHEHSTDQVWRMVDGAKVTLSAILDELANSLPDGWPNVPANKLAGKISIDNIDIEAIAEALSGSAEFPETLKELWNDSALVAALASALSSSSAFSDALKTLLATSDIASVISKTLKTDSSFMAVVRDIFTTLLATGGVAADGVTLIQIADIAESYPPQITSETSGEIANGLLPCAVMTPVDKGALVDNWPAASASSGWQYTLPAMKRTPQVRFEGRKLRDPKLISAGAVVVSDGRAWYEASIVDQTAWPVEMNRPLISIPLTDRMFAVGTKFSLVFTFAVNLVGNCDAQYMLVLKTGVPRAETGTGFGANIDNILWDDPIIEEPIVLSEATVFHTFGLTLSRQLGDNITGTATRYGKSEPLATPIVGAKRVIYACLERFDAENVTPPTGLITLSMTGAKAAIVPL